MFNFQDTRSKKAASGSLLYGSHLNDNLKTPRDRLPVSNTPLLPTLPFPSSRTAMDSGTFNQNFGLIPSFSGPMPTSPEALLAGFKPEREINLRGRHGNATTEMTSHLERLAAAHAQGFPALLQRQDHSRDLFYRPYTTHAQSFPTLWLGSFSPSLLQQSCNQFHPSSDLPSLTTMAARYLTHDNEVFTPEKITTSTTAHGKSHGVKYSVTPEAEEARQRVAADTRGLPPAALIPGKDYPWLYHPYHADLYR